MTALLIALARYNEAADGLVLLDPDSREQVAELVRTYVRVGGYVVPGGQDAVEEKMQAALRSLAERSRAKVITLCGSTRFKDEINAANQQLTMDGNVVISLGVFGHTDLPDYDWTTDKSDIKRKLDGLHFQKIDMADEVRVVNPGGYVGESTQREIEYAKAQGKPVTYTEDPNCPVHRPRPTCPECGGPSTNTGHGWIVCTKRGCPGYDKAGES